MYKSYKDLARTKEELRQTNTKPSKVVPIQSVQHKNELITSIRNLCIDVYADWCEPCKMAAPLFEELAEKYCGGCVFAKENSDNGFSPDVKGVPTFLFFSNGTLVHTVTGADMVEIEETIRKMLQL